MKKLNSNIVIENKMVSYKIRIESLITKSKKLEKEIQKQINELKYEEINS